VWRCVWLVGAKKKTEPWGLGFGEPNVGGLFFGYRGLGWGWGHAAEGVGSG